MAGRILTRTNAAPTLSRHSRPGTCRRGEPVPSRAAAVPE
jgi:hypothetical protein